MDNPFEMVFGIILVIAIASVLKSRFRAKNGIIEDRKGNVIAAPDPDSDKLREEVQYLKERVAVLEKIATDDRGARELTDEIEKLRDR